MEEKNNQELKSAQRKKLYRTLDAVGWGIFFIWIGVAFLANLGWGVGFIGVGLIILGALVARIYLTNSAESRTTKECC
jgi:hypothetical protein